MHLTASKALMRTKFENSEFDSYALYVRVGDKESTIFSKNVNEDTYFDMASCGKVLVTTPLILQSIDKGMISLESTLDEFF